MDPKKDLIELINKSSVSEEDKKMWQELIEKAPEEFALSLFDSLSDNQEEIPWFTEIYKRKKEVFALSETDPEKAKEMFGEILEEEKKKIQELNSKE